MKAMFYFLALFAIASLVSGCQGFVEKRKIVGEYYLQATDVEEQLNLAYCPDTANGCFPIIHEVVFAAGYSGNYLFAKQHPDNNKKITNYYILTFDEAKRRAGMDSISVPLTREQFEAKKKLLGIKNANLSVIFKEME
jgi:hypothetical protein